jgi:tetratricopeptide (TPR) repeat protein
LGVDDVSGLTALSGILLAMGQIAAGEPSHSAPAADLAPLVEQLGANKYEQRQQATEQLWSVGDSAIPALELGTRSTNPEIRSRAAYVLENLRQGITIDTPREILREVQRFRDGDLEARRHAMRALETAHRPRIVLGLIRNERESRLRDEWNRTLERSIRFAILAGADREAGLALRDAATNDEWMRHWAAYLADCGAIDEELGRLAAVTDPTNSAEHAQRIAYLLRAKGELSEARRYAELALQARELASPRNRLSAGGLVPSLDGSQPLDMKWELTLEMRDWAAAAREMQSRLEADPAELAKDPEFLGFAAAYHRLSGNAEGSQRFVRMLRDVAEDSARSMADLDPRRQDVRQSLINQQWLAGKALLLNGEHDDAIGVLKQQHASFVFELLAHEQRYREAFDVAGVAFPGGFTTEWFEAVLTETSTADDAARQKFSIAMHALRHLAFLGQRDQVRLWLASAVEGVRKDSGTVRRRMVCETAVKLGFRDLAREAGAIVLEREGSPSVLSVLYPNRHGPATVWFEFFREQRMNESLVESLARIDRYLRYSDDSLEPGELPRMVADAETRLGRLAEPKRSDWLHGLAETCLLHGEREMAWRLFEGAAVYSAADALRLGDQHAAERNWEEASEWYRRAWEFDKLKPLPGYLYAQALMQAGRQEEGERLAQAILRMSLGSGDLRRELAMGLKERGYRQESLRQFELLVRTAEPGEQDVIEAAKQIGNAIYLQEDLRAAECWETMVLCCLRSKWGFVEANGYVQIPFLVHKTRAKGLVRAGRFEEAAAEIRMARQVSPLNLELPEELIPLLFDAGRYADADTLFYDSYATIGRQCREFPECATLHNNLAWLVARNGRELEDAWHHARRAVELDPDNPSYLDTLGEVLFRRGQVAEAIRCAERCLELDARSIHYEEQIARYRAAEAGRAK